MPVVATVLWLAAGGVARPPRRPANPANLTFYNLRPRNLSTDIIEKDSVRSRLFSYLTFELSLLRSPNSAIIYVYLPPHR